MQDPIAISLVDERPMSWNKMYSGIHWTKRKKEADRVHELIKTIVGDYYNIKNQEAMFTGIVKIVINTYFKNRPLDSDNVCTKFYIDGLKGILIKDDDIRYVSGVTSNVFIDKENPRVEIIISER